MICYFWILDCSRMTGGDYSTIPSPDFFLKELKMLNKSSFLKAPSKSKSKKYVPALIMTTTKIFR